MQRLLGYKRPYIIASNDRERFIAITTHDFLTGLESIGRVNSTQEVYRRIELAGRDASRLSTLDEQDDETRKAITALLKKLSHKCNGKIPIKTTYRITYIILDN
jgi:hypothetical protein